MAGYLGALEPHHHVRLLEGQTIRDDVGELMLKQHNPDNRRRFPGPGAYGGSWTGLPVGGAHHLRMFTARAMTRAVVDKAMALCTAINALAHRVSGIVSVGEKAVALVKLT